MKTASEISVDRNGYAHDDEGNSWFVGTQYAGWFGNYSRARRELPPPPDERRNRYPQRAPTQRLPKMTPQEQKEFEKNAIKLILVLFGKKDFKSLKFVKDSRYKSELTPKQKAYFDSLVKRNQSKMSRLPDVHLQFPTSGLIEITTNLSDSERKAIERVVPLSPAKDRGRPVWRLSTQPVKEPPKAKPGGNDTDKKLQVLDALISKMPSNSFVKSIRDQVAKGRRLSEKQMKIVRSML